MKLKLASVFIATFIVIGLVSFTRENAYSKNINKNPKLGSLYGARGPAKGELSSDIQKLISEQKYQAAQDKIKELLPSLQKNSAKERDYVTHIGTLVQLEMALHGYESAVKMLREAPRPKGNLPRWALDLVYAQSLNYYFQSYSWEINGRERVQTKDKDLKLWTGIEIFDEINRVYSELLKQKTELLAQPREALGEFLTPNSYPTEIRGTLLDSVTYLFITTLSNRQSWEPKDASNIFGLRLKELLEAPGDINLATRTSHPLEKIASLLHSLKAAHLSKSHKEAALDAQINLYETLYSNFSAEEDRELILATFRKTLDQNHSLPWYSWGQAKYAELIKAQGKADSLIKARTLALEGVKAHPGSPGASNCQSIINSIEDPSYTLEAMAVDAEGRRSIELNYKNLTKLYFRSYAVDLKSHLLENKDYSYWLDYREFQKLTKTTIAKSWSEKLASTSDYQFHKYFVTPPKHAPGFYVVFASANEDFSPNNNVIQGAQMIFSDLVIVKNSQIQNKQMTMSVLNGISGQPESDVSVTIYKANYKTGPRSVFSQKTNNQGNINIPESDFANKANDYGSFFAIAEKNQQFTTTLNMFYPSQNGHAGNASAGFLYVDRSVYRPGQKLYFKSVLYSGNSEKGQFKVQPNQKFNVMLIDANNQVVQKLDLKSDEFGAAFGEFVIPTGKLLGAWSLRSSNGTYASVRVEEYKRPTFEVTFPEQKNNWRLNEKVSVQGLAKYYFGAPVTSGNVDYTIYSEIQLPWWCFYSGFHFFWSNFGQRSIVKSGKAKLKADGTFDIDFVPKADKRLANNLRDITHSFTVEAHVTDEGGETRDQNTNFSVSFSDLTVSVAAQKSFYLANEEATFIANRLTLTGAGRSGDGRVIVYKLKARNPLQAISEYPLPQKLLSLAKNEYSLPSDFSQSRITAQYSLTQHLADWLEEEKVFETSVHHKITGDVDFKIPVLKGGAYRVHITEKDSFGQNIEGTKEFIIADEHPKLALPFVALLKESTLEPGSKAQLFLHSAYKDQRIVIERTKFGDLIDSKTWVAGRDSSLIEYPVSESDRGGFEINIRMLNDYSFVQDSMPVNVPWSNKELHLEFTKFRDELRPGTKEKWSIKIKGPKSENLHVATAQILSFMYDKSLEAIAPYSLSNMSSIYGHSYGRSWATAEIGRAQNASLESRGFGRSYSGVGFSEDSMSFYSSYGIGGPGVRGGYGGSIRFAAKGAHREMEASEGMAEDKMSANLAASAPMAAQEGAPGGGLAKKVKFQSASLTKDEANDNSAKEAQGKGSDLRTQFQETSFFKPDLLLNSDGGVDLEFTVPDSVTTWKVYALAHTQDMKSGVISKEAHTIKDLLIRPYLPRFLREGDEFTLKVVVNNTSKKDLEGKLTFTILDHDTHKDITADFLKKSPQEQNFKVQAAKESSLKFTLAVPHKLGQIDIKVLGTSGIFTDGEQKSLTVLPSTLHLAESVFKIIKDKDKKTLTFDDLQNSKDPTLVNEKLVVTLNSQLFYNVLSALPYLVNYPYECSEQTLNRFLSTGILSSMYKDFPAIAHMAKTMSTRSTRLEKWDPSDPNRRMNLEESPWLVTSKGGDESPENLLNVLDERIAKTQRDDSISKLRKSQTALGGFPWFPGGPPSPYITLYILHGFSRALEFGVDVPKDMVQRAWDYMHQHYIEDIVPFAYAHDCCWEEITFLNYVLSNFPSGDWQNNIFSAEERKRMLDFSFSHWKMHSPYLKGYLALTLHRMGRAPDAKLVWDSVLDSAKVSETEGTHWQREDRSWLWYNDTTETQAFALRTGMELKSDGKLLDGLVLWLFLNKKLNHWSSTRSTSEVLYSLAHYLKATKQLGVREEATVTFGNGFKQSFDFPADTYMGGKNQIVLTGSQITPKAVPITVEKSTPGYMFASATWHYATDQLPKEDKGDFLHVSRKYFKRAKNGSEFTLTPITPSTALTIGDEIEVELSISAKHEMEYVHLRDPRPSGFEPVSQISSHKWDLGIYWYEEVRDSATNFFFEHLPHGEYNFKYRVRVAAAGKFRIGSAEIQPLYAPEFVAHSAGQEIVVKGD